MEPYTPKKMWWVTVGGDAWEIKYKDIDGNLSMMGAILEATRRIRRLNGIDPRTITRCSALK